MEKAIVTGILVKNNKKQYLLVRKEKNVGPYPNTWLTPGGYIDEGESADACVIRELYEETGVKVKNLRRVTFDEDFTENWKGKKVHLIMLLYTGNFVSGDLKPTAGDDDHLKNIEFFSASEIKKLQLSPPLEKLLRALAILN